MPDSAYLPLQDGARIAIIGGGPAGSLFAHFALQYARERALSLEIVIFDGKSFATAGAKGCNMCAGVIARTFADLLKQAGIQLSPSVVQRRIEGYWLETPVGSIFLHHELEPGGILTVYRGNGPRGSSPQGNISFDDHLLDSVRAQGVKVISRYATDVQLPSGPDKPARVAYVDGGETRSLEADLVVGAFGLNSKMAERVSQLGFGYRPPESIRSIQVELALGAEEIQRSFGNCIYVYALRLPGVKFAAITPKQEYLTVTMVGDALEADDLARLLGHPVVQRRLPASWQGTKPHCHCRPRVAISPARQPFADRLVIVGDGADSRLYKNGLESSFYTARAAAAAAVRYGVSKQAFQEHYQPVCRAIAHDSFFGKMIFWANDFIFSHDLSTRAIVRIATMEQQRYAWREQLINELIWSVLTGNRPYREIFTKALSPRLLVRTTTKAVKRLWRGAAKPEK